MSQPYVHYTEEDLEVVRAALAEGGVDPTVATFNSGALVFDANRITPDVVAKAMVVTRRVQGTCVACFLHWPLSSMTNRRHEVCLEAGIMDCGAERGPEGPYEPPSSEAVQDRLWEPAQIRWYQHPSPS